MLKLVQHVRYDDNLACFPTDFETSRVIGLPPTATTIWRQFKFLPLILLVVVLLLHTMCHFESWDRQRAPCSSMTTQASFPNSFTRPGVITLPATAAPFLTMRSADTC